MRTRPRYELQCRTPDIARGLALMALLLLSPPSAAADEIGEFAKEIIADLLDGMNPLLVDYEGVLQEQGLWEQPELQPELWNELLSFDITLGQLNELTGAVERDRGSEEPDLPIQRDELSDLDDLSERLFQSGNAITKLLEQTENAEEIYQG